MVLPWLIVGSIVPGRECLAHLSPEHACMLNVLKFGQIPFFVCVAAGRKEEATKQRAILVIVQHWAVEQRQHMRLVSSMARGVQIEGKQKLDQSAT